ncbi:MAG: RecX family transcriptional regulator [Bacteroidota bacterium]
MPFRSRKPAEERDAPELKAGRITRLVAQKKDPNRVSIYIDDRFAFGLHRDLLAEHRLAKGDELTAERQAELVALDRRSKAFNRALHYIGYQPRSERQVRTKLREVGFNEEEVDFAIGRLHHYRYLDDEAFARTFARSRLEGKAYGPSRVILELTRKGVARSIAESVVADLAEDDEVRERAATLAAKRWRQLARETDVRKRRKKVFDYLARRGYGFDEARSAVEHAERGEEGEE